MVYRVLCVWFSGLEPTTVYALRVLFICRVLCSCFSTFLPVVSYSFVRVYTALFGIPVWGRVRAHGSVCGFRVLLLGSDLKMENSRL